MLIQEIAGGVTGAKGFVAGGIHCGIRKNKTKRDLALIYSPTSCSAASVYTTNKVKGAPIYVTQENLKDGKAKAIICNSGNANTCNADGMEKAQLMCKSLAKELGISETDIIVASTGVIGQPLPMEPILGGMAQLVSALNEQGSMEAAEGIMTTDLIAKEIAVEFELGGKLCRMGGIAKGSGMINPNMATMLGFLTTDTAISPAMLAKALSASVGDTFNMVSVDGDTSTNDMVSILANGEAGNTEITEEGEMYEVFLAALTYVNTYLARMIAKDGEGATKLMTCKVSGAPDVKAAKSAAKSVISSSLVKAAMFGADANWGRVLCAIGYADCDFDITKIDMSFASPAGSIDVCQNGAGVDFNEDTAKKILLEKEVDIVIDMKQGEGTATAWGCDLTYEYVKINGDYRT